jgi:hypothetical protein
LICSENDFGEGCDFFVIYPDIDIFQLFEVQKCSLSIKDASDAVRQFKVTERLIKTSCIVEKARIAKIRMYRILLHNKRRGCAIFTQAQQILEANGIRLLNISRAEASIKRLYNLYRRKCLHRIRSKGEV